MKRRLAPCLLSLLLLCLAPLTGCKSYDPLPEAPGTVPINTTLENSYLNLRMTLPEGAWLYSINPLAFNNPGTNSPANWEPVAGAADDYYIELLHIGTGEDSTELEHASLMIFAESFPYVETLEDFANLTGAMYAAEELGYLAELVDITKETRHNTEFYRVRFESYSTEHDFIYESYYYVCKVKDLFVTIYVDYWQGYESGKQAVIALLDALQVG